MSAGQPGGLGPFRGQEAARYAWEQNSVRWVSPNTVSIALKSSALAGPLKSDGLAVLIRMYPDTVHRLAIVVEDLLAPVVGAVDGPGCAVHELAFAKLQHPDLATRSMAPKKSITRSMQIHPQSSVEGWPEPGPPMAGQALGNEKRLLAVALDSFRKVH